MTPLALCLLLTVQVDGAADARTYEDERLAEVLAGEGLAPFAPTAGDRVAFVRVVGHDVFTPDDFWPDWFNLAHVQTAKDVVERELLFAVGGPFERLDESARILRAMFIFSFVRVTPVRRAADGAVGVLVFVRDLWSLRLEQGFQVTGPSIDRLLLQLTERNLLGRAKVATLRFTMDPSSWSVGEILYDPRVFGGGLEAGEHVEAFFSRLDGRFDGVAGLITAGAPLYDLAQQWGFSVEGSVEARTRRQMLDGEPLPWDAAGTPAVEQVPSIWGERNVTIDARLRRQFTQLLVHRLALGVGFIDDAAEPIEETKLPPALADAFAREVLPPTRRTLFPFLAYQGFAAKHRIYEDLDTFGISEPVRLGPSLSVLIGAGSKAALSSSDTVFGAGAFAIADDPWGGLVEAAAEGGARLEDGMVKNRTLTLRLRLASAPVLAGRLLVRLDTTLRREDETNTLVTLGGDNGLRGYPSSAFYDVGASLAQSTLEWRSLPIDLATIQLGLAAFYDAGAIFFEPAEAKPHHSIGVGVRFLFPQFNRGVYRLDLAAPLDELGVRVLLSFGDTQMVEHGRAAFDRLVPRK
ncbi:MAG: hypothetical protein HYS27_14205 [Deltaproteobacteria bacterium]|nr:hypothetical protein [Deltaproteobacteria bacterium]